MEQQLVIHYTMESIQFMFLTTIFSQSFSLSLTVLDPAERFFKIITNLLSFSNKGIFALLSNDFILVNQSFPHKANCQSLEPEMSRENSINLDDPDRSPSKKQLNPEPEPDPEPPAAPPIIILSESSKAREQARPHSQVPPAVDPATTSSSSPDRPRYNLRHRNNERLEGDNPNPPEPIPAPPVIILSAKRRASASPPRYPPSIQTTTGSTTYSNPVSSATTSPTTINSDPFDPRALPPPSDSTATSHKRTMGSRASKLAPVHGKLQASQERQDKAEMKEPPNYYTHRSKSMRRKAGKAEGGVDAGGAVGGTAGGAGGAGFA